MKEGGSLYEGEHGNSVGVQARESDSTEWKIRSKVAIYPRGCEEEE